jgi:hypothetical protein
MIIVFFLKISWHQICFIILTGHSGAALAIREQIGTTKEKQVVERRVLG